MTSDRASFRLATAGMVVVVPMFAFCAYGFWRCPCAYDAIAVGMQVFAFWSLADTRARIRRRGEG